MSDVPESVTQRGVREVLRTFAESHWTAMTLEIDGMRISVGKNGPPEGDGLRPPDSQRTAEHRQKTAPEPSGSASSPTEPERTVSSFAGGTPDVNTTGEHRQFSAPTAEGAGSSPGESGRTVSSFAPGAPDVNGTGQDRQFSVPRAEAAGSSPGESERTVSSFAGGTPDVNTTGEHRQFSAPTAEGAGNSPGESGRTVSSLAPGAPDVNATATDRHSSSPSATALAPSPGDSGRTVSSHARGTPDVDSTGEHRQSGDVVHSGVDLNGCVAVRSPAVGAFWTAPSPGQPPFVQTGQTVAVDEQLAIVEVMKLMNPVVASVAGEVVQVCAANADLVEYDQVLFWIRPTDA